MSSLRAAIVMLTAFAALAACSVTAGPVATAGLTATPVPVETASPTATPAPIATVGPIVTPAHTADPDASLPWIAYQASDLRMVLPDGSKDRPALPLGPRDARHPDWSPDGARFTFVIDENDTRDIWIADWNGANAERVFDCKAPCKDADNPSWSPDGRSISFRKYDFVDGKYPGSELVVLDLESRSLTTVAATETPAYIEAPRWSPDGRSLTMNIATYTDPGGESEAQIRSDVAVLSLDDDTHTLRVITDMDNFPLWPDWHPTQDLILFSAGPSDVFDLTDVPVQLYTIRSDGSELTQLTSFTPDDPVVWIHAWAPDGDSILATVSPRDGRGHTLGMLNADGTGLKQLPGPIGGAHPRQRPLPQP